SPDSAPSADYALSLTTLFRSPAAAVPRLRGLSDPDVDDRIGRACGLPHARRLSRRGGVRQPLEADRTLALHLSDHRAHRAGRAEDRKSTRLNSSHVKISYAVF